MKNAQNDRTTKPKPRGFRQRLRAVKSVYDYGFSRPDDRFIPVASDDLLDLVASDKEIFGPEADSIRSVADRIMHVLDQEKSAFERQTAKSYRHFNPDRETIEIESTTSSEQSESVLIERLNHMLEKANFERLTEEQVTAAIEAANTHGMKVRLDLDRVSELSLWVRGRSESVTRRRTLLHPIKGAEHDLAVFNRLAMVASLKDEESVQLRLFKDIPIRDVEALLPHAKVRMNRKDAFMMVGGGAGATWSVATKLTVVSVAAASQLLWLLALPLAGLSWKVFSGYRRALKDRDSHRARHLYYQSLGSNLSAIHMLASLIAEEEIKEAILLFAFCSEYPLKTLSPESFSEIDRLIQTYLQERAGIRVDFDIHDAIETMDRLDLWEDRQRMAVVDIDTAITLLDAHWKEQRTSQYHTDLLGIASSEVPLAAS